MALFGGLFLLVLAPIASRSALFNRNIMSASNKSYVILNFPGVSLKNRETGKINFNNILTLNILILLVQHVIKITIINEVFDPGFLFKKMYFC